MKEHSSRRRSPKRSYGSEIDEQRIDPALDGSRRVLMRDQGGVHWQPNEGACPLCGGSRRRFVGRRGGLAHREGRGVVTNVVRCGDCGAYYTHPTLVPSSNPYSEEETTDYFRIHDPERKRQAGRHLAVTAESLLGRKGSILELGCGRGELLEGARDEGWMVCGIEMTPDFAAGAETRGVTVERSPVETAVSLERQFDVILFAAILEHLYRPADVLRRARRALPIGGLIFIDVPNEASLVMTLGNLYMRIRGRDWCVNLSPTFSPFHVVGFTPDSLRHVLQATGFSVVQMTTPRWCNALPQPRGLIELAEHRGLTAASWLGDKLGRGDGICCWARAISQDDEGTSREEVGTLG
jgi:2-polyprenyl-3-methyl-5-hydroxy-6-metoxy-1,4-benzoquinol methylase